MSKQSTKDQLLLDIKTEYQRLEKSLSQLTQEDMLISGVVGSWSIKDVLAHLTAWERLLLGWYQAGLRNETPIPNPVGMSHKAINEVNQQIYEEHMDCPLEEVLGEFRKSYQQTVDVAETISNEDMFTKQQFSWTGRWTLADYIAGNTCNHYRWAKSVIRQWHKNRSNLSNGNQESR